VEIDENAAGAYEQLKGLLMSRYTKDRWARAFELHKFPEIGDMKPSEMMRQMKALLPTDLTPGTYFMASFLLRLPADMINHIISKDFKDCTKMAEYADMLYSRRRGNTVAAANTNYEAAINAISGCRCWETSSNNRRQECRSTSRLGHSRRKTLGQYKDDSDICYYTLHTATRQESARPGASGSRKTEQLPRTKHSRRRLQTHTQFRFLVCPRAAGRPSRQPGAGLEVSETALQTNNLRRDPELQIRRRPLLHNTDSTVLVGFVPGHRRQRKRKTIAKKQDLPHN